MKKILFLLLFLQTNLVFGQIRQSVHLRESNRIFSVDAYRKTEEKWYGRIKKITAKSQKSKLEANYDSLGNFLSCKILLNDKLVSWAETKYNIENNLIYEKIVDISAKCLDTFISEFQYYRFSKDSMILLSTYYSNKKDKFLDEIYFEVINQRLKEKSIYSFSNDFCGKQINLNDSAYINKLMVLKEIIKIWEYNHSQVTITYDEKNRPKSSQWFEYKKYTEPKRQLDTNSIFIKGGIENRPIYSGSHSYKYKENSCGEYRVCCGIDGPPLIFEFELKDYDKIFTVRKNNNDIDSKLKYRFDKKGNWKFLKRKHKNKTVKIWRKIQYYD